MEAIMAENSMKLVLGALLFLCAVQDILRKKIYLWVIGVGAITTLLFLPFCAKLPILDRIGGLIIGLCIIILSIITAGKIGTGDGALLCITGLGLGFWRNLELFGAALFLAATVSIILLIFRLADRRRSIPFVPFLFAGYLILMITV
jgi:leader peptidase (prepilin peptidase)/N-methyltransferase